MFSLQALVRALCRPVYTGVGFLKMKVAGAVSWVWPVNIHLSHYSSSGAAKVPTHELELKKVSYTIVDDSCSADAKQMWGS